MRKIDRTVSSWRAESRVQANNQYKNTVGFSGEPMVIGEGIYSAIFFNQYYGRLDATAVRSIVFFQPSMLQGPVVTSGAPLLQS